MLFTEYKESGQSEFLELLDWRNTPTEGIGTSPAQRLLGRRFKTLILVAGTLLQPRYSTKEEKRALIGHKQRQQHYYNKHARPALRPIGQGETVPHETTWSENLERWYLHGTSWSAQLRCESRRDLHCRNRRQLIQSKEPPIVDSREPEPSTSCAETKPQQIELANQPPTKASRTPDSQPVGIRRSQRTRRPPAHLKDFVTK